MQALYETLKIQFDLSGLLDGTLEISEVLSSETVYKYLREGYTIDEIEDYILKKLKNK